MHNVHNITWTLTRIVEFLIIWNSFQVYQTIIWSAQEWFVRTSCCDYVPILNMQQERISQSFYLAYQVYSEFWPPQELIALAPDPTQWKNQQRLYKNYLQYEESIV